METLADKLALLGRHVDRAVAAVGSDKGASPVLVAVVGEFARKFQKAASGLATDPVANRILVVEVEQAADSAKVGAAADPGITAETRELVDTAHHAFCLLKFENH